MIMHINKNQLINCFRLKNDDHELKTELMYEDMFLAKDFEDFRINFPESYNHFISHFILYGMSAHDSYSEVFDDLFIEIILDEDYEEDEID